MESLVIKSLGERLTSVINSLNPDTEPAFSLRYSGNRICLDITWDVAPAPKMKPLQKKPPKRKSPSTRKRDQARLEKWRAAKGFTCTSDQSSSSKQIIKPAVTDKGEATSPPAPASRKRKKESSINGSFQSHIEIQCQGKGEATSPPTTTPDPKKSTTEPSKNGSFQSHIEIKNQNTGAAAAPDSHKAKPTCKDDDPRCMDPVNLCVICQSIWTAALSGPCSACKQTGDLCARCTICVKVVENNPRGYEEFVTQNDKRKKKKKTQKK